jgi:spore coat protein CotH
MDDLFNDSVLHEVRLTVHPSDWQKLQRDFLDNTYYAANFQWRGKTVEDVAIRSRGNGSRSSDKPGLKVDFNKYAPGAEFLGLKSLVLDNLTQDQTFLKERLALQLFRRMGIPAPRLAHARLYVNDVYAGLYTMVEPIDKGFLKRNLGEDGGHLYDYEWVNEYWFENLGDNAASYIPNPFKLETNENAPNPRALVNMIHAINESGDEQFVESISRHLDPHQFLTYLAVEAYLAEADGIAGEWGLNNFYLYGLQNTERFLFLPWDKDLAFSGESRSVWANLERNVLTRRMLAVPEWKEYFVEQLKRCEELAGGPGGWLEQQIEAQYEQVRTAVADDPGKPYSYAQFEEGMELLRRFAFERGPLVTEMVVTVP